MRKNFGIGRRAVTRRSPSRCSIIAELVARDVLADVVQVDVDRRPVAVRRPVLRRGVEVDLDVGVVTDLALDQRPQRGVQLVQHRSDHVVAQGEGDDVRAVAQLEAAGHLVDDALHGALRVAQGEGDLGRVATLGEQADDVALACRQRRRCRRGGHDAAADAGAPRRAAAPTRSGGTLASPPATCRTTRPRRSGRRVAAAQHPEGAGLARRQDGRARRAGWRRRPPAGNRCAARRRSSARRRRRPRRCRRRRRRRHRCDRMPARASPASARRSCSRPACDTGSSA